MDSYPRKRERTDAGADQRSADCRGHTTSRNDNIEVAGLAVAERHPEKVRYVVGTAIFIYYAVGLHRRLHANLANYIERLAEGSMISGMGGSSSGTQTQVQTQTESSAQSTSRAESSPGETRPYDPIRDV